MVVDFDLILEDVGDFGPYQKFVVYLLTLPGCFMNAFQVAFVFLGYTPDYLCVPDHRNRSDYLAVNWTDSSLFRACAYKSEDESIDTGQTGNDSMHQCTQFVYDQTYFTSTVVTEWNLVCDRAILPKTMMSLHSLITLAGCLINSYLQDLWGRKRAFFIVLTSHLIGGISTVFAPDFLTFAILRSFMAFSATTAWNVSYIWALEYVGPSKRSMVTMIMCVLYGVAVVVVGGMAWLCDTWKKLTLAGTVPFILLYSFAFLLDESPRWLVSRGRNQEALRTVRKMARWDKKTLKEETVRKLMSDGQEGTPDGTEGVELIDREMDSNHLTKEHPPDQKQDLPDSIRKPRVQDLFLTRNMRWKTCVITYCWAANLLTYLAIAYNMENLKGNFFVTFTLQAAMEIPAGLVIIFLLDRFGRIPPLTISMVITGLLLFCAVPVDSFGLNPWIIVALTLVAKFGITLSFGVLVQLAGESYPTQLRGLGTGFSSFVGTLGGAIMPYVVHSAKFYKTLPMIFMGATAVTSGISVLVLPETMGRYMPETIAEAEVGESVGLAALKENWAAMRSCRHGAYKAVKKDREQAKNGTVLKENDEL